MKHIEMMCVQFVTLMVTAFQGILIACITPSISQAASVSDLLITEIMANPAAVTDTNGEWFELFNPTAESVELEGALLSDDGSNSHAISTGSSLLINSGEYFVLARNADNTSNGGLIADYAYGSGFTLGNSSDQIILTDSFGLLRLEYSAGFVANGASMELIDSVMLTSNFAASTNPYGAGDFGSPGTAGSFIHEVAPSPVPLPAAVWLMGSGLLGLIGLGRRNRQLV